MRTKERTGTHQHGTNAAFGKFRERIVDLAVSNRVGDEEFLTDARHGRLDLASLGLVFGTDRIGEDADRRRGWYKLTQQLDAFRS